MKVYIIVGTRPNFIKVTQFKKAVEQYSSMEVSIIHTGQHYDAQMADVFFKQFNLTPDYFLNIAPGNPNNQIANIILKLDELLLQIGKPDLFIVVGDVNSTLAAAVYANKSGIPLAHLESGLRSYDRTMPEEVNRLITDELADYFFVTEPSGYENLLNEGKNKDKIFFVGNTMIDTLVAFKTAINRTTVLNDLELEENNFVLMTMHRPATVDNSEGILNLMEIIKLITSNYKLVFPVHPRTLKNMETFGVKDVFLLNKNIVQLPPLDYFSFQKLIASCKFVITDSGGIQEETTFLKKPCLTLRPNTERPITISEGTNTLVPFDIIVIEELFSQIKNNTYKKGKVPEKWDGKATERILSILSEVL